MERRALRRAVTAALALVLVAAVLVTRSTVRHRGRSRPPPPDVNAPAETRVRVQVLNATTIRGLARRAAMHLRDRGFDVVEIGTTSELQDSTLVLDSSQPHECKQPPCRTLKTVHTLKLTPTPHPPCDSHAAQPFGGALVVERLVTAFDQDGMHRGFRAADFACRDTA